MIEDFQRLEFFIDAVSIEFCDGYGICAPADGYVYADSMLITGSKELNWIKFHQYYTMENNARIPAIIAVRTREMN